MSLFRRNSTTEPPPAGALRMAPSTLALLRCPTCRTAITRVDDGDEQAQRDEVEATEVDQAAPSSTIGEG